VSAQQGMQIFTSGTARKSGNLTRVEQTSSYQLMIRAVSVSLAKDGEHLVTEFPAMLFGIKPQDALIYRKHRQFSLTRKVASRVRCFIRSTSA
jgi:hypothetical protein